MSALSHFADSSRTFREVREVPGSDVSKCRLHSITSSGRVNLLGGNFQAKCFGSLDVEHAFVFRRSLHREVGWLLAFQDAVVSVASNCTGASDKVAITAAWRASRRPGTGQQRRGRRFGLQSRAQAYVFNVFGWLAEAARG